jgi:uncharacterized protein YndB with AHSA1/START domain
MTMNATMKTFDLTLSRLIAAAAAEVFDVWMDPKSPGGPWHGAERLILQPSPDGLYYFSVRHEGRVYPHFGRFVAIERPRRVEYTWMSEGTKGRETTVTVTFAPKGKDTEVTLVHAGLPDDEMGHMHKDGWGFVLSTLAERFGKKK